MGPGSRCVRADAHQQCPPSPGRFAAARLVELPPPDSLGAFVMDHGGTWATACALCWVQEMGRVAMDAFSLGNAIQPQQLLEKGRGFAWKGFSGGS